MACLSTEFAVQVCSEVGWVCVSHLHELICPAIKRSKNTYFHMKGTAMALIAKMICFGERGVHQASLQEQRSKASSE